MKPVDLAKKLRRDAAFDPSALDRGKAALVAAIRQETESRRRPSIVPQVPYADIRGALAFLERAFGFREVQSLRMVEPDGTILHSYVAFGDSMIGVGSQGAHGAISPKTGGTASQYISVYIDDVDAHHARALAAGARVDHGPHDHARDYRVYEALDLEGHRWRFVQWLREPSV